MKWMMIAGGIAVVAGAVGVAAQRLVPAEQSREEAASEEPSTAQTRARRLSRIRSPRSVPRPPDSENAIVATDDSVAGAADDAPRQQAAEETSPPPSDQPRLAGTVEELEFDFGAEAGHRDLAAVEGAIERTVVAVSVPGSRLESLECRASMCRAAFTFENHGTEKAFIQAFLFPKEHTEDTAQYGTMSGIIPVREENEDGSRRLVMYLQSKG